MDNNEFKSEFDGGLRNATYATRKTAARIVIFAFILTVVIGVFGIGYKLTIGKANKNADREVFKESVAYNEQAASFLAKSYKEYNDAETDEDKGAIMAYVIMRYPNLDTDNIDNEKLKQFYIKCLND